MMALVAVTRLAAPVQPVAIARRTPARNSTPKAAHGRAALGSKLWLFGLVASAFTLRPVASTQRSRDSTRLIVRGRNYETNIRKKKGPAERKMAKLTQKHLRLIMIALKAGGPDPAANSMLDRYIRSALKDNVPRDTIDRRIKAFTEQKEAFEEVEVQGYGPGGAAVVVEAMTDNMNRTRNVGDHIFQIVGVLEFEGVDEEKVLEVSMEADAAVEDIITREDGIVEAITTTEDFHSAVTAFEGAGLAPRVRPGGRWRSLLWKRGKEGTEPSKSEVVRRVQVEAPLSHEQSYEVLKLLHQLEDCDDVGEVHHNAVFDPDPWS
eukprot:g11702.t1